MAFDPSQHFTLMDVQLWEAHLKRGIEYSPGEHDGQLGQQTRKGVTPQRLEITDDEGTNLDLLRVIVRLGLRGLHAASGGEGETETVEERLLFELEASFAVIYLVKSYPADDDFMKFVRLNCVHNAWPFWRQHVFDTLKRASLPVLPIPLFQIASGEMAALVPDDSDVDAT
ncbi:protein-export chaperone SecB [Stenotrophomonas maltophilia]|nr:protein-export chaperone SecB [Stenotrophomonas maltophilia]